MAAERLDDRTGRRFDENPFHARQADRTHDLDELRLDDGRRGRGHCLLDSRPVSHNRKEPAVYRVNRRSVVKLAYAAPVVAATMELTRVNALAGPCPVCEPCFRYNDPLNECVPIPGCVP